MATQRESSFPTLDALPGSAYGRARVSLDVGFLAQREQLKFRSEARAYWEKLLNSLFTHRVYATDRDFASTTAVIEKHQEVMQILISRVEATERIAEVLSFGEELLLEILEEQQINLSGRVIELNVDELRIVGALLASVVDGQYRLLPRTRGTQELDRARMYLRQREIARVAQQTETNTARGMMVQLVTRDLRILDNPIIGAGGPVDISGILRVRQEQIEQALSGFSANTQRMYLDAKTIQRVIYVANPGNRSVNAKEYVQADLQRTLAIPGNKLLEEGRDKIYEDQVDDPVATLRQLAARLNNRELGIGGRFSIADELLIDFREGLLTHLAVLDWRRQSNFLAGFIETGIATIDELNKTNLPLSRQLFELLEFTLFDKASPVVIAAQLREQQAGARVKQTLYDIQKTFLERLGQSKLAFTELGYAVAADNRQRTIEQQGRNINHIFAARQAAMVGLGNNPELMNGAKNGFIAGTENLLPQLEAAADKLERAINSKNHEAIASAQREFDVVETNWLLAMYLVSPAAYMDLAWQLGAEARLKKTNRYAASRMNQTHAATRATRTIDAVNIGYREGGKLDVTAYPFKLVESRVAQLVADDDTARTIGAVVTNMDKFSALGDGKLEAPIFYWLADYQHNIVSSVAQQEIVADMLSRSLQLVTKHRSLENKRFFKFTATSLFYWGSALREVAGDDEVLKNGSFTGHEDDALTLREAYINTLLDILKDKEATELHQVVYLVVERHLPYWPLKDQNYLLESLSARGAYEDDVLLRHLTSIAKLLAVNFQGKLPRVEGEEPESDGTRTGIRRPVANLAVNSLLSALSAHQYANGRLKRLALIPALVGESGYQSLTGKEVNTLRLNDQALALQILNTASFIGDDEGFKKVIAKLTDLIQTDVSSMILELNPPPGDLNEMIAVIDSFRQRLNDAVASTVKSVVELVGRAPTLLIDAPLELPRVLELNMQNRLPENVQVKLQLVLEEAQSQLTQMRRRALSTDTRAGLAEIKEGSFGCAPDDLAVKSFEHGSAIPVEAAISALSKVLSTTVSEGSSQSTNPDTRLVSNQSGNHLLLTDLSMLPVVIEMLQKGNAAEAVAKIIDAMISANLNNQRFVQELCQQTGETDLAKAQSALKAQLIQIASAILSSEETREQLVLTIDEKIAAKQQEYVLATEALRQSLRQADIKMLEELTEVEQRQLRAAITKLGDILDANLLAAKEIRQVTLAEYKQAMTAAANRLVTISQEFGQLTSAHEGQLREYLKKCIDPNGDIVVVLRRLQALLNQLQLPQPVKININPQLIIDSYAGPSINQQTNL